MDSTLDGLSAYTASFLLFFRWRAGVSRRLRHPHKHQSMVNFLHYEHNFTAEAAVCNTLEHRERRKMDINPAQAHLLERSRHQHSDGGREIIHGGSPQRGRPFQRAFRASFNWRRCHHCILWVLYSAIRGQLSVEELGGFIDRARLSESGLLVPFLFLFSSERWTVASISPIVWKCENFVRLFQDMHIFQFVITVPPCSLLASGRGLPHPYAC